MRKLLVATLTTMAVLAFTAGVASSHTNTITGTCEDGLSVSLTNYQVSPAHANTVTVRFDDVVVAHSDNFGTTFSYTKANPDKTVSHTYMVDVSAWDDEQFDVHTGLVTIPSCETAPPPVVVPPPPDTCLLPEGCDAPPVAVPPVELGTPIPPVVATPVAATPGFTG